MVDIHYKPGTSSGPFSQSELNKFKKMLRVDMPDFEFDEIYTQFITRHNGGKPIEKYFRLQSDEMYSIDRFLNFADTSLQEDVLFNVHQNWNDIEDRLVPGMFPFAVMGGGDYLLFDHSGPGRARIVYWYHEKSTEGNPVVVVVSPNFDTFLSSLTSTSAA